MINNINIKSIFLEEVARTTPLGVRVLRLILKVQDLFHSYVTTPLTNMWYGPIVKADSSVVSLRKPLNSDILSKFCNILERDSNLQIRQEFLHSAVKAIPNLGAKKNSLLIPIVLKGIFENHIVLLVLTKDQRENKVFFYDPKGWTLEDHAKSKTIGNIALKDIFNQLLTNNSMQNNGGSEFANMEARPCSFQQNLKRVQIDSHNCALHVINVMQNISQRREPFENPLSFSRANTEARRELIDILSKEVADDARANDVNTDVDGFDLV